MANNIIFASVIPMKRGCKVYIKVFGGECHNNPLSAYDTTISISWRDSRWTPVTCKLMDIEVIFMEVLEKKINQMTVIPYKMVALILMCPINDCVSHM